MSKLKNIQALNQMLAGNHRTQTKKVFGFSSAYADVEARKNRKEGEIWEDRDENGKIVCWWELKNGARIRHTMHPDTKKLFEEIRQSRITFVNCPKDVCTCKSPTRLDEKFRRIMGMCEDCVISMETRLKMQGKFNQYAIDKMKANAEAFFKDADVEVEIIKREMKNINFAGDENETNPIETWSFQDLEAFIQKIDDQYQTFKEKTLENIEIGRSKS